MGVTDPFQCLIKVLYHVSTPRLVLYNKNEPDISRNQAQSDKTDYLRMSSTSPFLIRFNQFRNSMSIIEKRFFDLFRSKKWRLITAIQANSPFFIDSYGNSLIYFENIPLS
ncbi:hypothetical protein DRH13_04580 [Candidatus Woesebacteria bacterium]|nr:MAG: hypothetical protein DRH13_04580 [Candidatus Woesebacteria bacterium]